MRYKLYKFCENRARDTPLWGVYIPHFGQISVKISVLGSYILIVAPMRVKYGMEEGTFGPLLHDKFRPNRCSVSPLRGEKPQNRSLSKLNTGACASRNAAGKLTIHAGIGRFSCNKDLWHIQRHRWGIQYRVTSNHRLLERCNPWPHVANRIISIIQLLSLWRHSHYDVSRLRRSQPPFSLWRHSLLSWPRKRCKIDLQGGPCNLQWCPSIKFNDVWRIQTT